MMKRRLRPGITPQTFAAAVFIVAAAAPALAQPWDQCNPGEEVPFLGPPYGTNLNDRADDFTLPVLDDTGNPGGSWTYQSIFPGCDAVIFINYFYSTSSTYFSDIWNSSIDDLIAQSPRNVQYVFGSYGNDPSISVVDQMIAQRNRVEAALARLSQADRDHWAPRFHYVTTAVQDVSNWTGTLIRSQSYVWWVWGIDRMQRIRRGGLMYHPGVGPPASMAFATNEARYYNFEWARERDLAAEAFTEVVLWDGVFGGSLTTDADLPGPGEMEGFDTMLLDLTLGCDESIQVGDPGGCAEWDQNAFLDICDRDNPDNCPDWIGRWVTTYGRNGRWVTDASPYLAFIQDGGRRRFRVSASQGYTVTLKLLFTNRGKGTRPYEIRPLYEGGSFNESYNVNHPPMSVQVPAYAARTDLTAYITGHGWGVELDNCAEFCNHQHEFTFDGSSFMKEHPIAGTLNGCLDQIEDGTVPNQFGTWPFGRGGWCPGLDVKPFVVDLSGVVSPGPNDVTYRGLFNGSDYVPRPNPNPPGGFPANISMQSYIVYSIKSPEGPCDDGVDNDGLDGADCDDLGCISDPFCASEDYDSDGHANDADCAPLDGTAYGKPVLDRIQVGKSAADPSEATVTWADAAATAGTGTTYDIVTGAIDELHQDRSFDRAQCVKDQSANSYVDSRPFPGGASSGFYYFARAENYCGSTSFGRSAGSLCN